MPAKIRKRAHLDLNHDRELKERLEAWNAERAFIGQWMAKSSARGRQRRWRREDLYDRKSPGSC